MQITNSYRTNLAYVHGQVINSSKSPAGSAVVPNLDGSHYACDSEETQVPQDHKVFFLKNCEESNHLPEAGSDSKCRTLKIFGPAKY